MTLDTSPLPPNDISAEESIIGSIIIDGDSLSQVIPVLSPADFFREQNRWCYEAALALLQRHEPINQVTLAHELNTQGHLNDVGGVAYLSTVVATTPTHLHAAAYAQIVHRLAVYRGMISAGGRIASMGFAGGPDEQTALQDALNLILGIDRRRTRRSWTIADLVGYYLDTGPLAPSGVLGVTGAPVPTGYRDLDNLLGGLYPGNLVILAARPSIGKSALGMDICRNVATRGGRPVFFSLEMSSLEISQRLVAVESGVGLQRIRGNHLSTDEERAVMAAAGALAELHGHIEDMPGANLMQVRARLDALRAEGPIALCIVDYLQLVRASRGYRNRVEEVTEVTQELKNLARQTNLPFLVLSQLSRKTEGRVDHRPQLDDLRESGAIEQEADVVMLLHREAFYYRDQAEWDRTHPLSRFPQGITDVIVAKHRNGPTGSAKLFFREYLTHFENLARPEE